MRRKMIHLEIDQSEFFNIYYPLVSEFPGEFKESIPFFKSQLQKLAEVEDYEKCAKLRDLIELIQNLEENN